MGMKVYTVSKRIVNLCDIPFSAEDYRLLTVLQARYPNLPLRVEAGLEKNYVPIHMLDLERFESVRLLNL